MKVTLAQFYVPKLGLYLYADADPGINGVTRVSPWFDADFPPFKADAPALVAVLTARRAKVVQDRNADLAKIDAAIAEAQKP